ncbi:sigma factor [Telmatobacter sp. DSM 110680]|uniref:Sigma factor n=1 Tax=Telmatobacter sp. DSM 110680 TaxID=3036704 RepID=A0AAU7DJQ9_9BACT
MSDSQDGVRPCDPCDLAEQVARRSYGKLVAFLAATTRDVASAEDALSEAFATALADWPRNGCPQNPEAWLMTVARRKFLDASRSSQRETASDEIDEAAAMPFDEESAEIPDRRLGLMFACAHPAIDAAIRAPLMLQAILGLDAARIASAFLISPATMSQRLVRAKNKIRQAGIPLEIPERSQLRARLATVLDAIYAAFAEGWIDAAGTDVARRDLAEEAIYLGRFIVELLPDEPEGLGLLSLMLHAESRRQARRNTDGDYIPLTQQNPTLWNAAMIDEAESLLHRAGTMNMVGRYQLEAAIQSAHAVRARSGRSDWAAIVQLYDALFAISGSPVAAVNRALALAELHGARRALDHLDEVAADPRLKEYQPYWAARAELFARINARDEARHAYSIAIGLERDPSVRRFLEQRRMLVDE